MTFNKTLDLMRQVQEMLANARPDHPLREMLREAENLVRRDIVEQTLMLGIMSFVDQTAEQSAPYVEVADS
jgi:ATP-dependent RNA helicase HelY